MSASRADDRPNRRFPVDFLILGAQKAGTSWLHERLRETPGLWLPSDKDFEYFSYPGAVSAADYRERFDPAPGNARVGDACASYFWTSGRSPSNPTFAEDLPGGIESSLGPQARYIVLLRDPVERALSGYLHHVAFGSLDPAVALLDAPEPLGLIDIGRYGKHLDAWLARVGPERLCVLPAPGERPAQALLAEVAAFLGVDAPQIDGEDEVVFPGLRRWRDDSGVWVALGQPGVAGPVGPVRTFDGERATRLVDAQTLDRVADALRPDTERLARRLEQHGWVDPAYLRWASWPG